MLECIVGTLVIVACIVGLMKFREVLHECKDEANIIIGREYSNI